MTGYRGRLIFPFLAEIAQLDTEATAEDPDGAGPLTSGYDADFDEPVYIPNGDDQLGTYARKEKALINIPVQVEPDTWDALNMFASGNASQYDATFIMHFKDLEDMGLIDPNGEPMVRIGDRLNAIRDINAKHIQTVRTPPGLFVTEVKPIGFGLNSSKPYRNLLMVTFRDREQGKKT